MQKLSVIADLVENPYYCRHGSPIVIGALALMVPAAWNALPAGEVGLSPVSIAKYDDKNGKKK